jgi:tetratricopeptide (TPR) repeat protein
MPRKYYKTLIPLTIIAIFSTVAFAAPPVSATFKSPKMLFDTGKEHLRNLQYAAAIKAFSACLRRSPGFSQAYLQRGKSWDLMGVRSAAVKDYSKYIELTPGDPEGYIRRADVENFNLAHETALQDYSEAIKLNPSSESAHLGRGLAYTGLQRYAEAVKEYNWVLKLNPNSLEAIENMGIACMLSGRELEAMSYFEKALRMEMDPKWRLKIERWTEKLLQGASAARGSAQTQPKPLQSRF